MAEQLPRRGMEARRAPVLGGTHQQAVVTRTEYGGVYVPTLHMWRPAVERAMTMMSNMDSDEQRLAQFTDTDVEAVRHMAIEAYTYCPSEVMRIRGNLALVAHSLTTLRYGRGREIQGEDLMTAEFVEAGLLTGSPRKARPTGSRVADHDGRGNTVVHSRSGGLAHGRRVPGGRGGRSFSSSRPGRRTLRLAHEPQHRSFQQAVQEKG